MIPVEGVGVISNLPAPEVQAWMDSEHLHCSQAPDGGTLICLNSLLKRVPKSKTAQREAPKESWNRSEKSKEEI